MNYRVLFPLIAFAAMLSCTASQPVAAQVRIAMPFSLCGGAQCEAKPVVSLNADGSVNSGGGGGGGGGLGGLATSTAPTYTNNQTVSSFSFDLAGGLRTAGAGGGGGAVTSIDGGLASLGTTTDTAVTNPATAATLLAVNKGQMTLLSNLATALAQLHTDMIAATPAGTNAIGSVTSPSLLAAFNAATPAGTNTIGGVVVDQRIGDGAGGMVTPQFAVVSASAAGSNTLVAAVTGKRIKVLGFMLVMSGGANTITFLDAATPITGAIALGAGSGAQVAPSAIGVFQAAAGDALNLNLSAATSVTGFLTYVAY